MPTAVAHSHRPTTKVTHKSFKSRAASKHELRDRAKGKDPSFLYCSTGIAVLTF